MVNECMMHVPRALLGCRNEKEVERREGKAHRKRTKGFRTDDGTDYQQVHRHRNDFQI